MSDNAISPEFLSFGVNSAKEILNASIKAIDSRFQAGYAEEHPEILAAFMQAVCLTSHSKLVGKLEASKVRR